MSKAWSESKSIVFDRQNGRCAVCGHEIERKRCVGHHIRNRSQGGNDSPDNCEVRCRSCEVEMHLVFPNGNLPGVRSRVQA